MGEVWAARHVLTGKAVAVKQLICGAHERHFGEARARFAREAKSACAVDHPNVVEVFDFVEDADRSPIMLMELLQGETLAARLARGPLPLRELSRTILPVVSAVGTAHARGIVHRDLKPSNIFLDVRPQDGTERVKVLDFGIAKWLDSDAEDQGLRTRTGSTLGTPSYMAPEQATGDRTADHRADIWSLGVILYEAASGVRPLEGENAAQLVMRLLSSGIMPIEQLVPELPSELSSLIGRMLARDVARRPADLREVYDLLRRFAGEDSVPFGPPASVATGENTDAAYPRLGPPRHSDVDAFAQTLEPAPINAPLERGAALMRPTRTALLVPDDLVALETHALAPLAGALPPPRQRRARPLLLVSLALAAALGVLLVLATRSEHHTGVGAAEGSAQLAPASAGAPEGNTPSAAPAGVYPGGEAPRVVVNSLPLEAAALGERSEPAAHATQRPRPTTAQRERRRRAAAPARRAPSAAANPPVSSALHGATSTAPAATAPNPTPSPRGAECERSSDCASRSCVAYACQ